MDNICEWCKKPIVEKYGSGRFCSYECKQHYASFKAAEVNKGKQSKTAIKSVCKYCNTNFNSKKALEIHLRHCDVKEQLKNTWSCPFCDNKFSSRRLLETHRRTLHIGEHVRYAFTSVNSKCKFCGKDFIGKRLCELSRHEIHCYKNPNRKKYSQEGVRLTDQQKKQRSESMKKAHAEGKAYVWKHRVTEPTWPEQWLINVLKNELGMECGKDYSREVPYNGFFLDFCWEDRKIVIEMDGEQHERFQEQIERDQRKDALLAKDGYKELRIPWKLCFHNPKEWIQKIKEIFGAL